MYPAGLLQSEPVWEMEMGPVSRSVPRLLRFEKHFRKRPVFLSNLSAEDASTLPARAAGAIRAGAAGVLIEADDLNAAGLRSVTAQVRALCPGAWIGMSFGKLTDAVVSLLSPDIRGILVPYEPGREHRLAELVITLREWHEWEGLIFGVLSLGDRRVRDHAAAAVTLSGLVDVVLVWADPGASRVSQKLGEITHALGRYPVGLAGRLGAGTTESLGGAMRCDVLREELLLS